MDRGRVLVALEVRAAEVVVLRVLDVGMMEVLLAKLVKGVDVVAFFIVLLVGREARGVVLLRNGARVLEVFMLLLLLVGEAMGSTVVMFEVVAGAVLKLLLADVLLTMGRTTDALELELKLEVVEFIQLDVLEVLLIVGAIVVEFEDVELLDVVDGEGIGMTGAEYDELVLLDVELDDGVELELELDVELELVSELVLELELESEVELELVLELELELVVEGTSELVVTGISELVMLGISELKPEKGVTEVSATETELTLVSTTGEDVGW